MNTVRWRRSAAVLAAALLGVGAQGQAQGKSQWLQGFVDPTEHYLKVARQGYFFVGGS